MKRTGAPVENVDAKAARLEQLSALELELARLIATEKDEVKKADLRLQQVGLHVQQARLHVQQAELHVEHADVVNDPLLRQISRLERFEAEHKLELLEMELKIARAKFELENAKTERARNRAEQDVDDARKELKDLKENWSAKFAEKKAGLARLVPISAQCESYMIIVPE